MTSTGFSTLWVEHVGQVLRVTIDHPESALNAVDDRLHHDLTALELLTFRSEDHREALTALREKRPPVFKGR